VRELKFVPQSMLDTWADLGKIELAGTTLRIPLESVAFALTPAIRFLSLLEGEDTHTLLAKVKTETFVKDIGGEVMTDSCLVGETAYQVQPGFLAEAEALAAAQTAKATRKPVPVAPKAGAVPVAAPRPAAAKPAVVPDAGKTDETELLTRFLLESLD
jgi:hypothetical protein